MRLAEGAGRQPADERRRGRRTSSTGSHDGAAGQQQQVDEVGGRERGLGAQRAGEQQAERGEGGGAEQHREQHAEQPRRRAPSRGRARPRRSRPPGAARRPRRRQHLAAEQAGARERRGAEPLDDAVAALEAGGDGQRGERRRHDREREHAGREHVDAGGWRGRGRPARRRATPPTSTITGITTASSSCSPLRSSSRVSIEAWASTCRANGAAPGCGREGARSRHGAPVGELEEDVLEVALARGSATPASRPAPRTSARPCRAWSRRRAR